VAKKQNGKEWMYGCTTCAIIVLDWTTIILELQTTRDYEKYFHQKEIRGAMDVSQVVRSFKGSGHVIGTCIRRWGAPVRQLLSTS